MNQLANHNQFRRANTSPASGVWGSSSQSAFDSFVIFCVGNDLYREAAFRGWALSNGVRFKSLKGSYKGTVENSFIVNAKDVERCIEWFAGEESVLVIGPRWRGGKMHGDREATLVFNGGSLSDLGHFGYTAKEHAMTLEAWTYDPAEDVFYTCA